MRHLLFLVLLMPFINTAGSSGQVHDSLKQRITTLPSDTSRISYIIRVLNKEKSFRSATTSFLLENLKSLSEKTTYPLYKGKGFLRIAEVYRHRAAFDSTEIFLKLAEPQIEASGEKRTLCAYYYARSSLYTAKAEYDKGLDFAIRSVNLAEKIQDKERMAYGYIAVGNIYDNLVEHEKSIMYFKKSAPLCKEISRRDLLAYCHFGIANAHVFLKNFDESLKEYQVALDIYKELEQPYRIAQTYNNIGTVYQSLKQPEEALTYYLMSLEIKEKIGDFQNAKNSAGNVLGIYLELKKPKEAAKYLKKIEELNAKVPPNLEDERDFYKHSALIKEMEGNPSGALSDYKHYHTLHDSLFNENLSKNITEMEAKYENEKKQREIETLQRDKEIAGLQEERSKMVIISLAGGLLLLLLLIFLVGRWFLQKKKLSETLSRQNAEILEQKKEITDSIHYAKRIQEAILPGREEFSRILEDAFVMFRPRDVVSGDFYWITKKDDTTIVAAVDCTGHGVPGAFMSMVGNTLLNEIVNEKGITDPGSILSMLRESVIRSLKQTGAEGENKDGMDIALCAIRNGHIEFAGANNPVWLIRGNALTELKPNKQPIGIFTGPMSEFSTRSEKVSSGDCIYLFTDGYADQFGGRDGKKFKYRQLQEKLMAMAGKKMSEQKLILERIFEEWKGELDQVDDVCVIGIRI